MGSSENFCLRWNDFESNVSGAFRELRSESDFFDVTLVCDHSQGRALQAHKVILSACSPFFKSMLRNVALATPGHPNPVLYLRGVKMDNLESVLDFMYHGEVNVAQDDLNSFLAVAEDLQVKGLTQQSAKEGEVRKRGRPKGSGAGGPAAKAKRGPGRPPKNPPPVHDPDDDLDADDIMGGAVKNEPAYGAGVDMASADAAAVDVAQTYGDGSGVGAVGIENFDETYGYGGGDGAAASTATAGRTEEGALIGGEEGIDEGMEGDSSKAVTDLNELVMGLLTYSDGIHTCNLCGKKSPWRTTMLRHVEANHVETAGHVCDICGQVSKTRHAFAMHKKRKHKVNLDNEPLPDRPSAAAAAAQAVATPPPGAGAAEATAVLSPGGTTQTVTTVVTAEPTK